MLRLVLPLISSLVMSTMISGGLVVCPAEIVSAASSHPPVRPCVISSPQEGGSIGSEARSEHASTPRTCVHFGASVDPSSSIRMFGCVPPCSLRLPHGDGEGELHGVLTVRQLHRSLPLAELHVQFVALLVHQADRYRDGHTSKSINTCSVVLILLTPIPPHI